MDARTLGGWLVYVMKRADAALSLEESLHAIMDSTKEYFPCQSIAVILIDDDTKEMTLKISRQISYTFAKQFRHSGPGPLAERLVLEQETLLLKGDDPSNEAYRAFKLEHDFASAVVAPVVKNKRGVGYVFADRAPDATSFDDSDLLHLQVIGYLIGNMIEKFELLHATRTLSQIDEATGLLHYKAFVPAFATERQRARTHGYPLVLALFAVPEFRRYVQTHGIDAAHALLRETSGAIRPVIRDMDLLARFGADEFILCLSGLTPAEATALLRQLRDTIERTVVGKGDGRITVAVGAVALDRPTDLDASLQDVLSALGRRLVIAKAQMNLPVDVAPLGNAAS